MFYYKITVRKRMDTEFQSKSSTNYFREFVRAGDLGDCVTAKMKLPEVTSIIATRISQAAYKRGIG